MSEESVARMVALTEIDVEKIRDKVDFFLVENEEIQSAFQSMRDFLVITNKRLITIDKQGITGRKVEYMNIPFSKVTAFSLESAGTFDLDAELKIWVSALGKFELQFVKRTNIKPIVKLLSNNIVS